MGRPTLPKDELHERSFRVRLKDDDADLLLALARKADVPAAVLLRSLIRQQLPLLQDLRDIRDTQKALLQKTADEIVRQDL